MFIHLGGDTIVPTKDVIAIIDMKMAKESKSTLEFLQIAEDEGFVTNIAGDRPKSFVITTKQVYLTPISSTTLQRRAGFMNP
ncbi:hypothetical protein H0A61_00966 [Koleobacter methoxysyntrophicus]|jgi:hypothetical protein|uniref:DUF370 domain-containing protein n=1 Tax=Koleobacter methoxysyntrophicus TaxID=2751313 RepID=A0A8A0RLZ8_9FIRM|nr:DUF370 domain-containing protein [Koleobacter methoxysyntrophicus]QSQ08628.1 hypothetical protein H0A61_00966 [Koleobacter methoxysyntrophicus]